jgi:hypothetical protein
MLDFPRIRAASSWFSFAGAESAPPDLVSPDPTPAESWPGSCSQFPLARLAFPCYSIRAELFADLSRCQVVRSVCTVLYPARDFLPRAQGSSNRFGLLLHYFCCAHLVKSRSVCRESCSRTEETDPKLRFLNPAPDPSPGFFGLRLVCGSLCTSPVRKAFLG